MIRPTLLLVGGTHGAGKTTLAKALAQELDWPLVSRDAVRAGLAFSAGEASPEPGGELSRAAVAALFSAIETLAAAGVSVIAESTFRRGISEADLAPLVGRVDLKLVQCRVPRALAIERCRGRAGREFVAGMLEDRTEERWARVETPLALPGPVLEVDTSGPYRPGLGDIVAFATNRDWPWP